jgi:hypothetical protein
MKPVLLFLVAIATFVAQRVCCFVDPAFGETPDFTLTFAARPRQVMSSDHATTLTGHAFLIIGVNTSSGVKEEIFGFYPVAADGRGMIKGPGMLKSEQRCGPNDDCGPTHRAELLKRLSEIKESVTVPISSDERRAVYDVVKEWDSKSTIGPDGKQFVPSSDAEYRIFDHNCIDFVAAVASRLGYPTPDRSSLQTPTEYLTALKPLVAQEAKVRASAREASEMKKRAAEAGEKARAAEEKAKQAEMARLKAEQERAAEQARMIPAGWVSCTCPQLHSAYGKWLNGVLYHPQGIWCPK